MARYHGIGCISIIHYMELSSYAQHEGMTPSHLAVDKPSDKFLAFLAKHYKLRATIPQVNNYVVFDGFFTNRKGEHTVTL